MIGPYRVGAAASVVTSTEAKQRIRVDHSEEDSLITDYIAAATELVSAMTGLVLGAETWQFKVGPQRDALLLPVAPVNTVTTIAYLDQTEVVQSANVGDFVLYADPVRPSLRPGRGKVWPAAADRDDAITITVSAGLTALPPSLKTAILMMVAHWYRTREPVIIGMTSSETPFALNALIEPHKRLWAAA